MDRSSEKAVQMVNPVFSGSKMAWLKETQPEIYKKADRIFVVADYLLISYDRAEKT